MSLFRTTSLKAKQVRIILLTCAIALLLVWTTFSIFEVVTFRGLTIRYLTTLAQITGENCASALEQGESCKAEETLSALQAVPNVVVACVYTKAGEVFAQYQRAAQAPVPLPPVSLEAGVTYRNHGLHLFRPIEQQGQFAGTIYLQTDMGVLSSRTLQYAVISIVEFLLAALVALVCSLRLQRLISNPIVRLARTARQVAVEKNYSVRVTRETNDEVGELFDGFNEMLTAIQARDRELQAARDTLEMRVQERTRELANSLAQSRKAKQEILRNKVELEAIYDGTPVMMCLVNERCEVERMNRAMLEYAQSADQATGAACPGDILGCINAQNKPPGAFGPHCADCRLRLAMSETLSTGRPRQRMECALTLQKEGARRAIQLSASTVLVDSAGQRKVLLCLEDITQRTTLQAQLLQAQKMEAIGQLAGGVAHDFNNILAGTMLHLGLLQQHQKLDPEIWESLDELMKQTERAASLTRQLLMFSRRSVLEVKTLDLNELVINLLKMLKRLIGEHIDLQFSPNVSLPAVEADPGMVEQVIVNLCVNGRDAMPNGGKLAIGLETVQVEGGQTRPEQGARPGRFVCLSVADSGCGMDKATLQHIFEPFFTTKQAGKGTGLGLATVHGIVGQHKGWVEVDSKVGQGTTFRVFLPAVTPKAEAPAPAPRLELLRGQETILLVEDEATLRRVTAKGLHLLGYTVFEAPNGPEALRIWEKHHEQIDLLLSDMVMPEGITGLDLAEKLRAFRPGLKVIICSGYSAEMVEQGAPTHRHLIRVQKPFQFEVLSKTIRQCLDEK